MSPNVMGVLRVTIRLIVAVAIPAVIAPSTGQTAELDRAERQRVIDGVISNLKDR